MWKQLEMILNRSEVYTDVEGRLGNSDRFIPPFFFQAAKSINRDGFIDSGDNR